MEQHHKNEISGIGSKRAKSPGINRSMSPMVEEYELAMEFNKEQDVKIKTIASRTRLDKLISNEDDEVDEYGISNFYQKMTISDDNIVGDIDKEVSKASKVLIDALDLRKKYQKAQKINL